MSDSLVADLTMSFEKEAYHSYVEMWMVATMLFVFALVGAFGNSVILMVVPKLEKKTTSHLFIIAMAYIDLFTCVVIIPFTIVFEMTHHQLGYDVFCKLYHFLITSHIPLSAFIMVAIACDRYLCICHSAKKLLTTHRTKVTIAYLSAIAFIIGIVPALGFGVYPTIPKAKEMEVPVTTFDSSLEINESSFSSWECFLWRFVEEPCINTQNKSNNVHNIANDFQGVGKSPSAKLYETVFDGICRPSEMWIDLNFLWIYQKSYSFLFVLCFMTVVILYGMVYLFLRKRRSRRLQQKLYLCSRIHRESLRSIRCHDEYTNLDVENQSKHSNRKSSIKMNYFYGSSSKVGSLKASVGSVTKKTPVIRKFSILVGASKLKAESRSANIRTAMILFVVTAVFFVAFFPGWMMMLHLIPMQRVAFYMYFIHNIANPFIYAFMNHAFKKTISKMLLSCSRQSSCPRNNAGLTYKTTSRNTLTAIYDA